MEYIFTYLVCVVLCWIWYRIETTGEGRGNLEYEFYFAICAVIIPFMLLDYLYSGIKDGRVSTWFKETNFYFALVFMYSTATTAFLFSIIYFVFLS